MSAPDNLGKQFVMYHGTNEAAADGILATGANPPLFTAKNKMIADSYREMSDEFHQDRGGGVTIEGFYQGVEHVKIGTGDNRPVHPDTAWVGVRTPGGSAEHPPGLAYSLKHGAFVPTKLHYSDGESIDLT